MNKQLEEFARSTIKAGLSKLNHEHRLLFNRMYSPNELNKSVDQVVDEMSAEMLDHAMTQVQASLNEC